MSTLISTQTGRANRTLIVVAAISALALSIAFSFRPATAAAFTPGDHNHPTNGPYSDLNGGSATFTFETNAQLTCNSDDVASSFTFHIDITNVTGTLPAGATLVVYLSPNEGAINGNANGNDAAYIAAVESNFKSIDLSGQGNGTVEVTVPISTPFSLVTGGVLGVFASEDPTVDGAQSWNSKTNSLNCTEAQSVEQSVAESVAQSVAQSVAESVAQSVAQSGEQSVEAGTGTPAASTPDGALFGNGSSPLPTIAFSLILLASLGGLAYANVKSARR